MGPTRSWREAVPNAAHTLDRFHRPNIRVMQRTPEIVERAGNGCSDRSERERNAQASQQPEAVQTLYHLQSAAPGSLGGRIRGRVQ